MAELMTLQELADYLRVTPKTIYRLLRQRDIPAVKVVHQWRFERSAIDEWLQQRSQAARANVLVIDDEEMIRELIKVTLEESGYNVLTADTSSRGLEIARQRDIDLVFLDLKMPGMDGAEVFRQLKAFKPRVPVIIITGYPDSDIMARALEQGPFGVMNKPFTEADIVTAANNYLGLRTYR